MFGKESTMKLFKNPIAVFISAVLLTLAVVWFPEREQQIIGVICVCGIYTVGSFLYAIWEEKVSARRYQEENTEFRERINILEDEKTRLSELNEELEREIPKIIRYNSVHKRIKIKDNRGTATFSITLDGINISNKPIQTIKQTLTTEKPLSVVKALINEEEVIPQVKNMQFGNLWKSDIILDALKPVDHDKPIVSFYEAELDEEYREAFEEDKESSSVHSIFLRVDELITEIEAPDGFIFHPIPRTNVHDLFNGVVVFKEKDRMDEECRPTLDSARTKIKWIIKYPRLSYQYEICFHLESMS